MQRRKKCLRAVVSLLVGLPLAMGPLVGIGPASAQTAPSCPAGYYYASDGYCYPSQQPTYAYPPPVYDAAPPVYQPPPVVDGLAIGVGLGLLFGGLAASHPSHADDRNRARDPRGGHDDHGHH